MKCADSIIRQYLHISIKGQLNCNSILVLKIMSTSYHVPGRSKNADNSDWLCATTTTTTHWIDAITIFFCFWFSSLFGQLIFIIKSILHLLVQVEWMLISSSVCCDWRANKLPEQVDLTIHRFFNLKVLSKYRLLNFFRCYRFWLMPIHIFFVVCQECYLLFVIYFQYEGI